MISESSGSLVSTYRYVESPIKSVNKPFADMQKKTLESLEPLQNMNAVAAEAFERIARKNYDLTGDLVDHAVAQVTKLPLRAGDRIKAHFLVIHALTQQGERRANSSLFNRRTTQRGEMHGWPEM